MRSLNFGPAFIWELMRTDLELGQAMAGSNGVTMPVSQRVLDVFTESKASGRAQLDVAAALTYLADRSGVRLRPQCGPDAVL